MVTLVWLLAPTGARSQPILEPDVPVERELAAGETHAYRLELTGVDVWKVSVEQLGVDVELTLVPADGERVVTDSPLDRAGTESLVVRSGDADSFRVEVHARERAAPSGRYRILLKALGDGTAKSEERIAAETARMEAARDYARGAVGRPEALEHYRQAADHWQATGDDREETRDLYCMAVLERLVGQTRTALESARAVLPRWQRLRDRYWEAATLNEIGFLLWHLDESQEAEQLFESAMGLRRELGDKLGAVKTGSNVCLMYLTQGRLRKGLNCYRPLLEALNHAEEKQLAASLVTNIGWANDQLGEPNAAFDAYRQALSLNHAAGDRKGTAKTLNNLALLHRRLGEFEDGLRYYEQALDLFRELRDHRWEGLVLNNIGHTYTLLGEPRRARVFLREALTLSRQVEDRRGEVLRLINLGYAHHQLGELDEAFSCYLEALHLSAKIDDPRIEAMALTTTGWGHLDRRDYRQALDHGSRALGLVQDLQASAAEADALHLMGRALSLAGSPGTAISKLEEAVFLLRKIRSQERELGALIALAEAELQFGRLAHARNHVEAALELIEALRSRVGTVDLRALFQGSHREAYELYIDLLMAFHRASPNAGHDLEALAASERGRARALLDLLSEAPADIHQGVDSALIERRKSLGRRLNAKASRRSAVLAGESTPEERELVESELASALHDLDRIEAEIRRHSPRYAALTRPQPLTGGDIQELLDTDTILLEYALGEERSFLWRVSSDQIESFELPGREEIEAAARRFHQLLSKPGVDDRKDQATAASTLSEMLLAPIVQQLEVSRLSPSGGIRRLVVVADGALHYVPFGALPMPTAGGPPLLADYEVVYSPSISVLAEQRRRLAERDPPPGKLAVVADPVFDLQDPRLTGARIANLQPPPPSVERGLPGSPSWKRLSGSQREAEAILALASPGKTLAVIGFEASRDRVLDGSLGRHRVVHFATHGVIDTAHPRLSGLVLSLVDKAGQPRQGFLRTHDIFHLQLAAELVVLSGCQTALGREIRGEGLLGLTRGFMYAGAPRVVASLWRVDDRATAELMTRFYQAMWVEGTAPAAALRSARLSIWNERRWQDPYYWSSFVMFGDWQPTPLARLDEAP